MATASWCIFWQVSLTNKADMKERFNLLLNRVAMINAKIDDYHAEQIGAQRQLDKHEKWHFAVAKKVGVKLAAE